MRKIRYFCSAIYPVIFYFGFELIFFCCGVHKYVFPIEFFPLYLLITTPLTIPGIRIYFNYLANESKGKLSENGKELVSPNGETNTIDKVVLHHRNIKSEEYFSILSFDRFYYFEIIANNKSHYFTCLNYSKNSIQYSDEKNEKYPIISKSKENKVIEEIVNKPTKRNVTEDEIKERDRLIKKYKTKTQQELSSIKNSPELYSKEAVSAAIFLLKNPPH